MKVVVIADKPSVARGIAAALGARRGDAEIAALSLWRRLPENSLSLGHDPERLLKLTRQAMVDDAAANASHLRVIHAHIGEYLERCAETDDFREQLRECSADRIVLMVDGPDPMRLYLRLWQLGPEIWLAPTLHALDVATVQTAFDAAEPLLHPAVNAAVRRGESQATARPE
jgi:hypothetical protein